MDIEHLKQQSTNYLASHGIEVPSHLPLIEPIEQVNPKNLHDVANRVIAMNYLVYVGHGCPIQEVKPYLNEYRLFNLLSKKEQNIVQSEDITEKIKIDFTWLVECIQVFAWVLGLAELNHFRHCDDDLASKIPFKTDPTNFITNVTLKPIDEIQKQSDLLYRMHWYARNCSFEGKDCELNLSIIQERRKAIDWIYGVEDDWDEIPMDT